MSHGFVFSISDYDFITGEIFKTRELAEAAGREIFPEPKKFYVAEVVKKKTSDFIGVNSIVDFLEQMASEAYEEAGEASEEWLDHVPKKDVENLYDLLKPVILDWFKKTNNEPYFYGVIHVRSLGKEQ